MFEVIRDGRYLAFYNKPKLILLRDAMGNITPTCEKIVEALDNDQPWTLDGVDNGIAEATQQMVMPPDGVRDGSGDASGTVDFVDRP